MNRMQNTSQEVGYKWISAAVGVRPAQSFRVSSIIGTHRSTAAHNGFTQNTWPKAYQPEATLRGHLTFAMKYEGLDLDFLSRVFAKTGPGPVVEWVKNEPTSAYARQYGFLYEWLTGTTLAGIGDASGNYVDLLDESKYLVATTPDKVRRWRINNNLPGTREFCPLVAKTEKTMDPGRLTQEINNLVEKFGAETVERAVNWLTKTYPLIFSDQDLGSTIAREVLQAFEIEPSEAVQDVVTPNLNVRPRTRLRPR